MLCICVHVCVCVCVYPEAKPVPIGCSPFGPRQHSGWALIFFRRHKPHADWPSPGRARYAWPPPPPLDMAMGVDFDQEKRQEGTGQTGRQKERHLEGGRLELEQASAASPEKKVPLTHWHFRGVPSLKLEV